MVTTVVQDFEDGSVPSAVTIEDSAFGVFQQPFARGSYCLGPENGGNGNQALKATWQEPDLDPAGLAVSRVRARMYETSSQSGSGLLCIGPDGATIAGIGSNNNQWNIRSGDDDHEEIYGGDNYEVWLDYIFEFDWTNGEVTFDITDPASGHNERVTRTMLNNPGALGWVELRGGLWDSDQRYHWWDDLEIDLPDKVQVSGTVKEGGSTAARDVFVYATDLQTMIASGTSASDGTYNLKFRTRFTKGFVIAKGSSGFRSMAHGPVEFAAT